MIKQDVYNIGFEVFTAVTMKNTVFWEVEPCRSCVNRRFGGTYRLHLQGKKICERGTNVSRWQQTVTYIHVCDYPDVTASNGKMADELERVRKETVLS
jgi:hypothetical protein